MTQVYTYYKSTNFPNDLYPTQLLSEIAAVIATHVNSINIIIDNVDIEFASAIPDVTILDGVVAAHVPSIVTYQTLYPDNYILYKNNLGTSYTYFGTQASEIHISKDTKASYRTLGDAIAANNSPNNVFIIHPGTYIENNPIVIPIGSSVRSLGTSQNTTLIALNPSSDLLILGINCRVFGLTLFGSYGSGARGIYMDGSASGGYGRLCILGEVIVSNCDIGVESNGNNGSGVIDTLYADKLIIQANSKSLTYGVYCHSGGQFIATTSYVLGTPGYFSVGKSYYCVGANSKISLITGASWFCTTGLELDDSGTAEISLLSVNYSVTGIKFGTTGTSRGNINSLSIRNSALYDLDIQASSINLSIYTSFLDDSKFNNPNNVEFNIKYNSEKYGTYYQTILGSTQIGSVFKPSEIAMGEGLHNIHSIIIFTNDNIMCII